LPWRNILFRKFSSIKLIYK